MSKPGELVREAPPASEAPDIIPLPAPANDPAANDPAPKRKNGRAISAKPGSQISRRRPVKDPRSARFELRCTPAVLAKLYRKSEAAGLSASAFVCALIDDGNPGPRARRRASEATRLNAQMRAEMSKRGGNLNQCAKNHNIIGRVASEGAGCERLTEMVAEMIELYRETIAEHRATCAEIERALGLRPADPDDDDN
jgi:hypothetical protein